MGRSAFAFASLAVAMTIFGCGDAEDRAPASGNGGNGGLAPSTPAQAADPCGTPAPNCPCTTVGATTACRVVRVSGGYASCSEGTLHCGADGRWSSCEGAATVWGESDAATD